MRVEVAQAEKREQKNVEIGQQFFDLTVVERLSERRYKCQCVCGNHVEMTAGELLRGRQKSCGCRRRRARAQDITGMRSGKLLAIRPTSQMRRNCTLWLCQCDCGKELLTEPYKIRNGLVQSCGCGRKKKNMAEIAGQRFGRLVAIQRLEEKRNSNYLWLCQCDCGKTIKTTANALRFGNTKSCGCGRVDAALSTIQIYGNVADHNRLIDGTNIERLELNRLQANNTSGYTGVQVYGEKYVALIGFKGRHYYLGSYDRLDDAIDARKKAEEELHGPFLEWYYKHYPAQKKKGAKSNDDRQGIAQAEPRSASGNSAGTEPQNRPVKGTG